MIALEMMMRDILAQRTTQHPWPIGIAFERHSSRTARIQRSAYAFRLGERGGSPDDSNALPHEHLPKCSAVLRVAIEDQIFLARQRSVNHIQ